MGITDWFFPKQCLGCGKWGEYVCGSCAVGMWEEEQICPSCGRVSEYGAKHMWCKNTGIDGVACLYAYDGIVKRVVETMKYRCCFDVINCFFSVNSPISKREDLAEFLNFVAKGAVVVPVPLWPVREKKRGFNQAGIIAEELADELDLRRADLLIRIRDTGKQVGRSREERLQAVKAAFAMIVRPNMGKEKRGRAVIVDDVWTTGATMRECGKELKKAGFTEVWGFVLAR